MTETASDTKKVVINVCFGGFGLSDAAYEKLIEWGVPVRKYIEEQRDPETKLYVKVPENEGEVIFDRDLADPPTDGSFDINVSMRTLSGRYWESWTEKNREHPLVLRAVEELGDAANGRHSRLRIVEIPADVDYEVSEYDGSEHIAETHRTWYGS